MTDKPRDSFALVCSYVMVQSRFAETLTLTLTWNPNPKPKPNPKSTPNPNPKHSAILIHFMQNIDQTSEQRLFLVD